MSEEFNKFESHCSKCVFATYMNNDVGPQIQSGCLLGRIEKFKQQERARSENYSYIVEGICNTNRGTEWANANDSFDLIDRVKKEVEIGIDIVILSLNDDKDGLEQKLEKVIDNFIKQNDIQPRRIILAIQNTGLKFKQLYHNLNGLVESYDINFQLMQLSNDLDISECVNMAVSKCDSQYSAVFDINTETNYNFISHFNQLINEDLKRIVLVEPIHSYSGMIVQTRLFKLMGKNHDIPIFTKIKEICDGKDTDLVITWNELCPQK